MVCVALKKHSLQTFKPSYPLLSIGDWVDHTFYPYETRSYQQRTSCRWRVWLCKVERLNQEFWARGSKVEISTSTAMIIFVNLKSPLHLQPWLCMLEFVFLTGLLCNRSRANSIILAFLPSRIETSTDPQRVVLWFPSPLINTTDRNIHRNTSSNRQFRYSAGKERYITGAISVTNSGTTNMRWRVWVER